MIQYRLICIIMMFIVPLLSSIAAAQEPKVTITGGADKTAHNYEWTITNKYTSPIVSVEFPHHHADIFKPPTGWTSEKVRGKFIAKANSPSARIFFNRPTKFTMRISAAEAIRGTGTVKIKFADGSELDVDGVELPRKSSVFERFGGIIVLVLIIAAGLAINKIRKRNQK